MLYIVNFELSVALLMRSLRGPLGREFLEKELSVFLESMYPSSIMSTEDANTLTLELWREEAESFDWKIRGS